MTETAEYIDPVKIEHHVAGDETIGWRYTVDHRSVWCGDISRQMFEEQLLPYEKDCAGGSDMGWFIVVYDDSKPLGEQSLIMARVLSPDAGRSAAEMIARYFALSSQNRAEGGQ